MRYIIFVSCYVDVGHRIGLKVFKTCEYVFILKTYFLFHSVMHNLPKDGSKYTHTRDLQSQGG